jgi:hypothetical protein
LLTGRMKICIPDGMGEDSVVTTPDSKNSARLLL